MRAGALSVLFTAMALCLVKSLAYSRWKTSIRSINEEIIGQLKYHNVKKWFVEVVVVMVSKQKKNKKTKKCVADTCNLY